eukprot:32719_1
MAQTFDLNPKLLSVLRIFDLSAPYCLLLESDKNITNTRDCLNFIHEKIYGVFISLRKYSRLYFEDSANPISDAIFNLIEAYHGTTNHSDYLTEQIQIHFNTRITFKIFWIPQILGWIETITILIINLLFIFNIFINTIQIWLYILLYSLMIHILCIIYQYIVYCNPGRIINPNPSKVLNNVLTGKQIILIKCVCLMKWVNILQYNYNKTDQSVYHLSYIKSLIFQKYFIPLIITIIALYTPQDKYDLLWWLYCLFGLPTIICTDIIFRIVRFKRRFFVLMCINVIVLLCALSPVVMHWNGQSFVLFSCAFAIIQIMYGILMILKPSYFNYKAMNQISPAFMHSTDPYSVENRYGSYAFFVGRYFGELWIGQSFFILYIYTKYQWLLIMVYIMGLISMFLYYLTLQIKLLQMFTENCITYSHLIYWYAMVTANHKDYLQYQNVLTLHVVISKHGFRDNSGLYSI